MFRQTFQKLPFLLTVTLAFLGANTAVAYGVMLSESRAQKTFDSEAHPLERFAQADLEESEPVDFPLSIEEEPLPTFSDLEGNGWEAEAVYSLLERYDCLEGFPDGTFRGEEAMTRYQFAAGMFACLVQMDNMLQARIDDLVTKEDLALLFRALSTIFEEAPAESSESDAINPERLMPNPLERNLD